MSFLYMLMLGISPFIDEIEYRPDLNLSHWFFELLHDIEAKNKNTIQVTNFINNLYIDGL